MMEFETSTSSGKNPLAFMDFYRTLPSDFTAKSKSGGMISIATLVVIFVLLWAEIGHFFSGRIK
jgi:hypothetical protein